MLFVIEIQTTERFTVDVLTRKEAEAKAAAIEKESNEDHHHGEKTKAWVLGQAEHVERRDKHVLECEGCCPDCGDHCPDEGGTSCGGR